MSILAFARRALKEKRKKNIQMFTRRYSQRRVLLELLCCKCKLLSGESVLVYFKDRGGDGWEFRSNKGKHSRQNKNREHRRSVTDRDDVNMKNVPLWFQFLRLWLLREIWNSLGRSSYRTTIQMKVSISYPKYKKNWIWSVQIYH